MHCISNNLAHIQNNFTFPDPPQMIKGSINLCWNKLKVDMLFRQEKHTTWHIILPQGRVEKLTLCSLIQPAPKLAARTGTKSHCTSR